MTRLANVEKAGYFPLPATVTDLVATYITAPHGGRLLDPCAGKGTALITLAEKLNLRPFGIELHKQRAQAAKTAVAQLLTNQPTIGQSTPTTLSTGHVLHDSYQNLITNRHAYNLLFLNPPYDRDEADVDAGGRGDRLEYQWLVHTRPWLQPDGLLIWVIPQHLLRFRKATRYLLAWYDQLTIYRFPDSSYDRFHQIVVFGTRRGKSIPPDGDQVDLLADKAISRDALPALIRRPELVEGASPEPSYILPAPLIPAKQFTFRSHFVDPADALAEAKQVGASTTAVWRQHLDPDTISLPLQPLTPLKIGHMHSIIAAGHLNNQVLEGKEGNGRFLIKGRSYKVTHQNSYEEALPDGGTRLTHLDTDEIVTDITSIDTNGKVKSYKGADLASFLERWLPDLTDIVAQEYPPVYQFDLNGYGQPLDRLSQERPIPGLNGQVGLLPAQKHAAAAVLTRLERYQEAIIVGEMGSGKTTIGAAIAAVRQARRTIVLCPPHLVAKWEREFKIVWPSVRTMPLQTIADVDQFFAESQPDKAPLVGVLKQTAARTASGWEHAYNYVGAASHGYGSKGFSDIQRLWGSTLLYNHPQSKRPLPLTEKQVQHLRQRGVRCPLCGAPQLKNGRPLAVNELKTATHRCRNLECQTPLYQFTRRRTPSQQRGSFQIYRQREQAIRQQIKEASQHRSLTTTTPPQPLRSLAPHIPLSSSPPLLRSPAPPLRESFGYAKAPLAGYIKKRARGKLDLLLIDEVHQYKGIDSDQGYAMHHLAQAAHKTVALTGTIYGGKASSLFYLLFRLSPDMHRAYVNSEETGQRRLQWRNWVNHYGIMQRIETVTFDEDGQQTANSRSNVRFKELPGGSPALLPWLLNRSVFLSLRDMGFPLPDYTEIPMPIPLAPAQAILYEELKAQLMEELKVRLVRNDKSLLAGYLYALLFWPDSPRRAKVVRCPRTDEVIASIPALPDSFVAPKETAVIDRCLREKAASRRVLLLCQQTDTLDIQPEWKAMLEAAGLKTAILRAAPNKREKWVEQQVAKGVDVIISHPRKVETGIDLLDFPTIIWMAIDYSVYTVLQASRRSWRIGQTQPVKVYFYCYENTLQEDALQLVAAKVAAALRVNGDSVNDDSLAELDTLTGGDLVATLAKIVTGDTERDPRTLQQAFAEANASLQQANVLIGDYSPADSEPLSNGAVKHLSLPTLVNGQQPKLQNGRSANGIQPNGAANKTTNGRSASDAARAHDSTQTRESPPVPRPRLLLG